MQHRVVKEVDVNAKEKQLTKKSKTKASTKIEIESNEDYVQEETWKTTQEDKLGI